MSEEIKKCIQIQKEHSEGALKHLEAELQKIRAGKAAPQMLDGVRVDYYGTPTALSQVAAINTPDAKQITIQAWEKNMLGTIEKAILAANLGFTPQNTGELIRIVIPPITEERRRDLMKRAKAEGENAKVAIRNIRRDTNEDIKKLEKSAGLGEDVVKTSEKEIQELTNKFIERIDKILVDKEKDIMTV
ncbi:MAG: ribosome recycling factor [Bacteroidales bacterium]